MEKRSIIAALGGVVLAFAASAQAAEFNGTVTVWSTTSSEQDTDGNGTGFATTGQFKGSFGEATGFIVGDAADWDGSSFCDFDEGGNPIAVPVDLLTATWVLTYANGDQLWIVAASSPPSVFCSNFIDGSLASDLHWDVIGGTGRFAGATGTLVSQDDGQALPNGITVSTATIEGEVVLATGN